MVGVNELVCLSFVEIEYLELLKSTIGREPRSFTLVEEVQLRILQVAKNVADAVISS